DGFKHGSLLNENYTLPRVTSQQQSTASGAAMPTVADVTVQLAECVPSGVDVDIMPEALRPAKRTALDILHNLIWNAVHSDGSLKFDIEVVETWREVAFHSAAGVVRFVPAGEDSSRWRSGKQRRTTRIPYSALFLAARNLFGDK
ncbi:hypothetical protein, partial [Mesorhizobium sp. YM1C-6-2]|uniref:hypothetical protein n=1 Tax=Mesorhizobium sp. YM1C-6-2 TaxID=1827501 RepID=UPI000F1502C3